MKQINYLLIAIMAISITGCKKFYQNQGSVFGTYYNIQYKSSTNLESAIKERLQEFDASLSMYNQNSIISRINRNEDIQTNTYFEEAFKTATYVNQVSQGAFDITVAPLVNAWGFGFKNKENITQELLDSLLEFVRNDNLTLTEDHHIIKSDPRTMMDMSALAKGYACDVIADLLAENGCKNYLVDIGGEVVVRGKNSKGEKWAIGITKPIDDTTGQTNMLQDIVNTTDICMATSGNYRNYYFEEGVRRSHTIDPRTGYPIHHKLLSATVIAPSCVLADALATSCMVMGEYAAAVMLSQMREVGYYFILTDEDGELIVKTSSNWLKLLTGKDTEID